MPLPLAIISLEIRNKKFVVLGLSRRVWIGIAL
jgi:hypothetical protein